MTETQYPLPWPPAEDEGLPDLFRHVGWTGVWTQLVIITGDTFFMVYGLLVHGPNEGLSLREYLVFSSLVLMSLTTFIFYRYAKLGERLQSLDHVPRYRRVLTTLWFGLWIGVVGITFSLLLMFNSVIGLVMVLLDTPQPGLAVAVQDAGRQFLTAMDGVTLLGSLIVLTAEMLLVALTLWLLFRVSRIHTMANSN